MITLHYITISNSAIPLIALHTRVTCGTSITNDLKRKIAPFVIHSDLSDCYITVRNIKIRFLTSAQITKVLKGHLKTSIVKIFAMN